VLSAGQPRSRKSGIRRHARGAQEPSARVRRGGNRNFGEMQACQRLWNQPSRIEFSSCQRVHPLRSAGGEPLRGRAKLRVLARRPNRLLEATPRSLLFVASRNGGDGVITPPPLWRSASAGVPLTLVFELGGRLELILGGVHGRAPDLVARVISHLHRIWFDGDVMRSLS
jgi:hypothetical protein